MGGGNAEAGIVFLVAEGNDGAAVPADKIALSLFRIPFFAFFELGIALLFQQGGNGVHGMKGAGTGINKVQKLGGKCFFFIVLHGEIPFLGT